jgi:putative flippase GtrA
MILKMLKYGLVGLLGTLLHFGSLFMLVEKLDMNPVIASAIGFILVLAVSYMLNKKWTFQVTSSGLKPLLKYTVVSGVGLLLNIGLLYTAVEWLHWNYLLGQCLVVVAVPLSNFVFNNYWTFQENTKTS